MQYAIIENGFVINTVISDLPRAANWIESDTAGIGWTYDGSNFVAPPAPPAPVAPWTRKDFLLKFTPTEYAAIKSATLVDSGVDYYWAIFQAAENVLKTDPVTIAGINALETAGLIGPGRAAEILA